MKSQTVTITPDVMREHEAVMNITINVKVRYHWRVKLALWLILLGCRIGGIGSKISEAE